MHFKSFLVAAVAALAINEVAASCFDCHSGDDVCGCSGSLIRPAPSPKIDMTKPRKVCKMVGGVDAFKPIGDTCTCDSQLVLPAVQPKLPCTKLKFELDAPEKCSDVIPAPAGFSDYYFGQPSPSQSAVPADPVSLTLAFGMAQKAAIPEERLQFGPRKKPEDGSLKKTYKNVPEERLFAVDREIVELKAPKIANYPEDDFDDYFDEGPEFAPPAAFLSYSDLGYGPVKPHNPEFLVQRSNPVPPAIKPASSLNFDCGFVPGKIVVRDHVHYDVPKPCAASLPASMEQYDESIEEVVVPVKKSKRKKPCFL